MADLPKEVTNLPDPMLEATKQTADLQAQEQAKEATIRAQQQAATQPVQQQRTDAGTDYKQALEKGPEQAPLPVNEAKHMDPKQMSDSAGSMMALAGLVGAMLGAPITVALRGMTGAMKGVQEADEQQFKEGYQKYKDNMNEALRLNDEKLKAYDRVLKGKEFNIREIDSQLKTIGEQYGDQIMMNAKDFKTKIDQVNATAKAMENARNHKEKNDEWAKDYQLKLEKNNREKKASEGGASLTDEDLQFMAKQRLAGDKSVFQNLGRGAQGAANIVKLRHAIMEEAKKQGIGPEQVSTIDSELAGITAGERTLGARTANVEMAGAEAQKFIKIANDASEKVDRTQFKSLNSVLQAAEKHTGGEDVIKLATATNSLINAYARAISPSGTPTVSDKEHARDILDTAFSKGQFKAATDVMMQEIDAAKASPGTAKEALRELRGQGHAQPQKAPDQAIAHLKANPALKDAFKAKYGYLPEGM